jgi:uncharacterized protein YoxC
MQGLIETEDGKVFELDSPKGSAWLESIGSFRFEPAEDSKPCTIRKEASGYWYGCRKVAGKVRKKYIGKSSEVSTAKLEEIAAALEVPPVQRVNKVAEVVGEVAQIAQEVAQDRLTVLELEVAELRKMLETLQEPLSGKVESPDSTELPKIDSEVAEELHNELSNLKAENELLRQELAETKRHYNELLETSAKKVQEVQAENEALQTAQSAPIAIGDLPEAADLLNQLKTRRKKSSTSLADVELILGMIEESCDDTSQGL